MDEKLGPEIVKAHGEAHKTAGGIASRRSGRDQWRTDEANRSVRSWSNLNRSDDTNSRRVAGQTSGLTRALLVSTTDSCVQLGSFCPILTVVPYRVALRLCVLRSFAKLHRKRQAAKRPGRRLDCGRRRH